MTENPGTCNRLDTKTVEEILRSLKINKAAGLDKIPARLLRDTTKELTPSIKSLVSGTVPALWKVARVTPLHKTDDTLLVESYRPISVLPALIEQSYGKSCTYSAEYLSRSGRLSLQTLYAMALCNRYTA